MNKNGVMIGAIIAGVALLLLGLLFFRGQRMFSGPAQVDAEATRLGFTYLPVTPRVSAYYDLGVNSGALVTSVTPGSPADTAGVKAGDVILSFDGTLVEETTPLLGMVMACPAGHTILLEVRRGKILTALSSGISSEFDAVVYLFLGMK